MLVLDLCAGSGAWSLPYVQAGYEVRRVTLPDLDVRTWVPPGRADIVLAAPPCTEFSIAKNGQARDFAAGLSVVYACLAIIQRTRPRVWALENPRGLLSRWLGKPALEFEPFEFGDAWTKRTCLWGEFSPPARSPVAPLGGISEISDPARAAITPPHFAAAFFAANNPAGLPAHQVEEPRVPCACGCGELVPIKFAPGMEGMRIDAAHFSNACRQRAYRARVAAKRAAARRLGLASAGK